MASGDISMAVSVLSIAAPFELPNINSILFAVTDLLHFDKPIEGYN